MTDQFTVIKSNGQLTINKIRATITATDAAKYYGHDDPADYVSNVGVLARLARIFVPASFAATESGFVNGDKVAYRVTRANADTDSEPGIYADKVVVQLDDEATGTANKNYIIDCVPATFTIYKDALAVTKTIVGDNDVVYGLNDTVTFKITVENTGNTDLENVVVEDSLTGAVLEGASENGTVVIPTLAAGEKKDITATYVVQEKDLGDAEFKNTATATAKPTDPDPIDKEVKGEGSTDPIPTEKKNGHLTVTKTTTSTPAKGATYALGETITYSITATNDGNLTLTDITVSDELTGDSWTIASLAPGATSEAFKASHVVTEVDILKGEVVNVATATGTSPDPDKPEPEVTPGEEKDPTEDKNGHLTVTKTTTSTPANGTTYALGETITYSITATNDGNLTLTDITVNDELTGDSWTIASLAPGATSGAFTTSHVVTEADILKGEVVNVATATGTSPDPDKPEPEVTPGEKKDPTDKNGASLFVEKTAAANADGTFALGETVSYTIRVVNNGNMTISNTTVTDDLTKESWTIETLAPKKEMTFTTTYVVTEADIAAGKIVNVATAIGKDPAGNDVTGTATKEVTTDTASSAMAVSKAVTNLPSRGYFYSGETATFDITVTNTGNQTLSNIVVADQRTGATLTAGDGYTVATNGTATIATLGVGKSIVVKASYTVTAADVTATNFVNVATATTGGNSESGSTTEIPTGRVPSSGGNTGGGGSSSGPNTSGGSTSGGPGSTTVTIDPDAVPLASLPNDGSGADGTMDGLVAIDDEGVPLAALPKTGDASQAAGLFFMFSGMMLALGAMFKKKDEQ